MKAYRPRDRTFLRMAWLAGFGGVLIVGCSIGIPVERMIHHQPWSPEFFFLSVWGMVACCGCAACIHTYYTSGSPPRDRPPKGGLPDRAFTLIEGGAKTEPASERTKRAA